MACIQPLQQPWELLLVDVPYVGELALCTAVFRSSALAACFLVLVWVVKQDP